MDYEVGLFKNGVLVTHGGIRTSYAEAALWAEQNNESNAYDGEEYRVVLADDDAMTWEEYLEMCLR